jgi:two-component system cell cycle sensor histidine kinase/response regulator CckA
MSDQSPFLHKVILVVEDQELVRRVMVRVLREEGYTVFEARNGDVAMEVLASGVPVNLVVTDIVMPGMGGFQLADRLQLTDHPPILLFITGYDQDANTIPGPLLRKPFEPAELAYEVKRLIGDAVQSGDNR